MNHFSVGAIYCVYDDERWLNLSIESIYACCQVIYFLVNQLPWFGKKSNNSSTLECIKNFPDYQKKIRLIQEYWPSETVQRNAGLDYLNQDQIEYCLVVDADEIYEPEILLDMFKYAYEHPLIDCWHMQWFTYWKSMNYIIAPKEPFEPVFLTRARTTRFTQNRLVTSKSHGLIPPSIGLCHHLSYARSDEEILKKITTFSHAKEILPDWYQNIWLKWDDQHSMQDLHPTQPSWYKQAAPQPFSVLPSLLQRQFVLGRDEQLESQDLFYQHRNHILNGQFQLAREILHQLIETQYKKRLQVFQKEHLYFEIYPQLMALDWQKDPKQWFKLALIWDEMGLLYSAEKHVAKAMSMESSPIYYQFSQELNARLKKHSVLAPPEVTPADVSLILLTYNQKEFTTLTLESVFKYSPEVKEIIIIDNGSTDGTVAYLESLNTEIEIKVVKNDSNLGFARGVNQGMKLCKGSWILLLNNDVVVTPYWLSNLLRYSDRETILSPVYGKFSYDQSPKKIAPFFRQSNIHVILEFANQCREKFSNQTRDTHRLSATCMLFHKEALDKVGGFDPLFEIGYFEDDDWCYRAQLAGFKLVEVLDTFIYHFGGATMSRFQKVDQLLQLNWFRFCDKWGLSKQKYPEPYLQPIEEILHKVNS